MRVRCGVTCFIQVFDKWPPAPLLHRHDAIIEWIFHALCQHGFVSVLPEWRISTDVKCALKCVCVCVCDDGRCSGSEGFTAADATDYTVGYLTGTDR